VLERGLETAELLRGEEGDEDRKPVCTYFGKGSGKFISSFNEFKLATNKTLGMP